MGPYLSEPVTDKKTFEGKGNGFTFCVSQMQGNVYCYLGWRKTMEDADIHEVNLGDGNSLFAVFDGHGGIASIMKVMK